jgi:hypothetical protein
MSPRAGDIDRELRIKATAALRRDFGARVDARRGDRAHTTVHPSVPAALVAPILRPWLRVVIYVGFAVAIALPWLLLLADPLAH